VGRPIATTTGICFAFPDILSTPAAPSPVPLPYPNVAQLSDAKDTAQTVNAGGKPVILEGSSIDSSTGGEAGSLSPNLGKCTFSGSGSGTVLIEGQKVIRQGDTTSQNGGNATGSVMVGLPTVLVGG
jgi:uncharacterized Zn-binding protein involved in type VI secretion